MGARSPSCPGGLADTLKFSPGKESLTPGFAPLEGAPTSGSPRLKETQVQGARLIPRGCRGAGFSWGRWDDSPSRRGIEMVPGLWCSLGVGKLTSTFSFWWGEGTRTPEQPGTPLLGNPYHGKGQSGWSWAGPKGGESVGGAPAGPAPARQRCPRISKSARPRWALRA